MSFLVQIKFITEDSEQTQKQILKKYISIIEAYSLSYILNFFVLE